MAEAAQRVGYYGSAPTFVPLCKELSVDEEPEIRQALAEQLPQLARIFTTVHNLRGVWLGLGDGWGVVGIGCHRCLSPLDQLELFRRRT